MSNDYGGISEELGVLPEIALPDAFYFDETIFQNYWISWDNKMILQGSGSKVGSNRCTEYHELI